MRAFLRLNAWDWNGAEEDIRKSAGLRKTAYATEAEAKLAVVRGDLATAEALLLNVLAVDPLESSALGLLAYDIYPAMGRFDDSDRILGRLSDIDPKGRYLNAIASFNALSQGNLELALALAEKESDAAARENSLANVYSAMGKPELVKAAVERLLRVPGPTEYWIAETYAYIGEKTLAFEYLGKAYDRHSPNLLYVKTDPSVASLRTDERYKALLRKLKLPES
jgi:tetratricopeptide (TPR) repeat protein